MMFQGVSKELFVRRLGLVSFRLEDPIRIRLGSVFGIIPEWNEVIVIADVSRHILEGQAVGILLAPIVERRADGLGDLESRNVMATEAAVGADGLLAHVPFQMILPS